MVCGKADQLRAQVLLVLQALPCRAGAGRPGLRIRHRKFFAKAIPGLMKTSERRRRLQHIQKGVQLGTMRIVMLWINLPDKRLASPEGAHHRVFATHKIQVAGPQQMIEIMLRE